MLIDLTKFNTHELSEIWSSLNSWKWHNLLGDKPVGFDNMTNYDKENFKITKYDIISPINRQIEETIGFKECLRGWHIFQLNKTNNEFEEYWNNKDVELFK